MVLLSTLVFMETAKTIKSHFIYMSAAVLSNTSTKNQPTKSSSMVNCLGQIK